MVSRKTDRFPSVPEHVCIIMDGNGRWARKRLMPRSFGHKSGVETTRTAIEVFARAGVKHLTLFAFSSENWSRPADEVNTLMELFLQSLQKNTAELNEKGIRIRFIGDRMAFNSILQDQIASTEMLTQDNQTMTLNIAANYGGRWDIVNAVKNIASQLASGLLSADKVDEALLENELSLSGTPDPDLFIRTGGEHRISNFLIWQLAYTEFIFSDVLWPDFNEQQMLAALADYASRQRRFGKTGEQVESNKAC